MKLIIDIDEDIYNHIVVDSEYFTPSLVNAFKNGTPIPDNATTTNGDVIKAVFPDAEIHLDGNEVFFHHMGFWIRCNIRWWNAPYQKGGKE